MRENFIVSKKKIKILSEDFDKAIEQIKHRYPHAQIEGSINHYLGFSNDDVVAEMWLSRTGKNWWLKIRG